MDGNIQAFDFNGAAVRTVMDGGEVYFVGKDVCERLGYTNPRKAMDDHCRGVTRRYPLMTAGGMQEVRVISEPDLMRLICSSQMPDAVRFEKWVFEEVLPAIRKTGGYMVARTDETPEQIMARALMLAKDTMDRQQAQLAEQQKQIEEKNAELALAAPKAAFVDHFCVSSGAILVRDFAKHIAQALDMRGFGEKALFAYLKEAGYLNLNRYPTQRAADLGLFRVYEGVHTFSDGTSGLHHCSKITAKGQTYFYNKLKAKYAEIGRWW